MGRRYFNDEEKNAIYFWAGGKCQRCGADLPSNWHADHVEPHSKGGVTDLVNAQALCPKCSLEKGASSKMQPWPSNYPLRPWQSEFEISYFAQNKADFLLVATPGAGKTIACLKIAHRQLSEGRIRQVVVVCPTDHLRNQWIEDATLVGIHLDKLVIGWGNVVQTSDYVGLVTTYAQVANKQEVLKGYILRGSTLVIFDEIHHCGDDEHLSWGPAIRYAFESASKRLLASGTPFRTDNNKIPFAPYQVGDGGWLCPADYSYGYGNALRDKEVVRDIVFPAWDGILTWGDGFEEKVATFQDLLSETDSDRRLRTAIHPQGKWIDDVLISANEKLDHIRNIEGHKDAGGLVIAEDQASAVALAKKLEKMTGEKPALAISNEEDSSGVIKRFRSSSKKWIVSVRMVSEGVDIKRLRVGVYATNWTTRMFFRQAIGRVLRWIKEVEAPQTAWFYVPEDPKLVELMKEIKAEILHWIRDQEEESPRLPPSGDGDSQMRFYQFVASEGIESDHYYSGVGWSREQRQEAALFFGDIPGFEHVPEAAKALALEKIKTTFGTKEGSSQFPATSPKAPKPRSQEKTELKSIAKRKVGTLVMTLRQQGIFHGSENEFAIINGAWVKKAKPSKYSTNEDLKAKIEWLSSLIGRALDGRWDGTELR